MVEELQKGWRKPSPDDGGGSLDKRSRRTRPRPPLTFQVGAPIEAVKTDSPPSQELTSSDFQHLIHISSASIACFTFKSPIPCELASSEFAQALYTTESKCLEGNHRFADTVGAAHLESILNHSISELLPQQFGYEDLFREWHQRSLTGAGFEVELLDRKGRPLTHHAAMYGRIDNELLYRVWIILRDITPFTRAVRALGRTENHYHNLLDSPDVLLMRVLADGTIDYASDETRRILRITSGRLSSIEEILEKISPPTELPACQQLTTHRVSGDVTPLTLSLKLKTSGNRLTPYTLRQVAHISGTGELDYFDLFGYPNTSKSSTDASGTIHDLNNQLMVIQSQLELALNEHMTDGKAAHIRQALASANIAAAMTAQALGRSPYNPQTKDRISATELLASLQSVLTPLVPTDIELIAIPCAPDLILAGHIHTLHQIITNLVINARDAITQKAITQRGQIVLSARPSNRHVEISVRDNGPGMSSEILKKIFTPYFTTKSPSQGTGLGLSMVKSLVEECGGHITASSSVGVGTTFSFTLPLASPHIETRKNSPPLQKSSEALSILVADDETAVRDTIISALTHRGHAVTSASDSKTLLECLQFGGVKPDLIIIDNGVASTSEDDVLKIIRNIAPRTPILVTSGDPSCAAAYRATLAPYAFIAKPFGLQELYAQISAMVPTI